MKNIFLGALLCASILALAMCGGNTVKDQSAGSSTPAENQVTAAGVTMTWSVTGANLSVKLSAVTTGWVAVGFNPSAGMQGANIIIGYVSAGNVFIRDDYGNGATLHTQDTTDNVANKTGTETGGVTEINFTIPLDSGDPQDQKLAVGNTYNIILAYGSADDFGLQHANRAAATIKIQ